MILHPTLQDKEKVSITLQDQLNGIKTDIEDVKRLTTLLEAFFDKEANTQHLFIEYGTLNETIKLRLSEIYEELDDLTRNKLETKK